MCTLVTLILPLPRLVEGTGMAGEETRRQASLPTLALHSRSEAGDFLTVGDATAARPPHPGSDE